MDDDTHRRSGVRAWPADARAREALRAHLAHPAPDGLIADQLDFRGAALDGVELVEAYLPGANLAGTSLVACDLTRATLSGADLRGADLSDAELARAEAVQARAEGARLTGAHAFAVDFTGADLRHADLSGAILNSSRFAGADLRDARLTGASLRYSRFGPAGRATRLTGAVLHDCPLTEARGWITGPVDVGSPDGTPRPLDGAELVAWLAEQGAPGVSVTSTG